MNLLIVGAPHSYTSVVAKHYINQGWKISSKKESLLDYEVYEPNYSIKDDFDLPRLVEDINSHDGYVYKLPLLPLVFKDLLPKIQCDIKIIYVIRNPLDIISSSMEKGNRSADYYLSRIAYLYDCVLNSGYPVEIVMGENYVTNKKERKVSWKIFKKLITLWRLI